MTGFAVIPAPRQALLDERSPNGINRAWFRFWNALRGAGSSSYAPTATAVANVATVTPYDALYDRVGDDVRVSGRVDVSLLAAFKATQFRLSLPQLSDFTSAQDCAGVVASADVPSQCGAVYADPSNDAALVSFVCRGTLSTQALYYNFTYRVR